MQRWFGPDGIGFERQDETDAEPSRSEHTIVGRVDPWEGRVL